MDMLPTEQVITCFVCSVTCDDKNYTPLSSSMNHSHAPLLVLLTDVLGYKLDDGKLAHSHFVCNSCYRLIDVIDELQQTLTDSKTEVRTKFMSTVQRLKLKYPRTDKMLKPRCLRCVQLSKTASKKKLRIGKSAKGKVTSQAEQAKTELVPGAKNFGEKTVNDDGVEESDNEGEPRDLEVDVGDTPSITTSLSYQRPLSTQATPSVTQLTPINQLTPVFDTDPAFFSPNEKLKVGIVKQSPETNFTELFHCFYCSVYYNSALSLKMHTRVYHMPVLVYDNGQGTPETRFRMGIKLQNAVTTQFSTTEKPFACLYCESAYKLQSSLQSHFRENHSPLKPFECLECKESFRKPIELTRHRVYRCTAQKDDQK